MDAWKRKMLDAKLKHIEKQTEKHGHAGPVVEYKRINSRIKRRRPLA